MSKQLSAFFVISILLVGTLVLTLSIFWSAAPVRAETSPLNTDLTRQLEDITRQLNSLSLNLLALENDDATPQKRLHRYVEKTNSNQERVVPFYSQFKDISAASWRKVGCGIASLAMLIDYYEPAVSVDRLLAEGITAGAYIDSAGWSHWGLIGVAEAYGLTGEPVSVSHLGATAALTELKRVLVEGPVMASVYYTFTPGHPIPHLVVINDIKDGVVYYNDPAEATGGGTIATDDFLPAWKQRYITIRPAG